MTSQGSLSLWGAALVAVVASGSLHCSDAETEVAGGAGAATPTGGGGTGGGDAGGPVGGDGGGPVGGGPVGGAGAGGSIPSHTVTIARGGVSARWAYEEAYDNVEGGDWYRTHHNETATLAWGESYVMTSLAAMFRATGSPEYLARLIWHADGVLDTRDDARGVTDYRGVSGACWRNLNYQPNDEPYCYVVHSGMIVYPMVELARLVEQSGLGDELAHDGLSFADKAATYLAAAEQTVALHDDQWNDAGYYVFRPDASFLAYAGSDLPLNQSNAMGRLLLALADVTGNASHLDKATKLAERLASQITTGSSGEYLWNYWGGAYSAFGEDISHAAINVDFAAMAAAQGVVFDAADLEAFARTFLVHVYVDDRTLSDHLGGGSTNGSSYRPQAGRWLRLTPVRTAIYTAVRDIYELDYPASGVSSGSLLHSWAYLAEFEPIHCEHFYYLVDWFDPDPNGLGDWQQATAYGANILTTPPALSDACMISLEVDVPRVTDVQQYDGADYHTVARWLPTSEPLHRFVPYEPRWDHVYWEEGVLYQLADAFVAGDGIRVRESEGVEVPVITSSPPGPGQPGVPLALQATGTGDAPTWWGLVQFPTGARIDPATGLLQFTPLQAGSYAFTLLLQNDWGSAEQSFDFQVP